MTDTPTLTALRLRHPDLGFHVDATLTEHEGRWLSVAMLADELDRAGSDPREALRAALAALGEPVRERSGSGCRAAGVTAPAHRTGRATRGSGAALVPLRGSETTFVTDRIGRGEFPMRARLQAVAALAAIATSATAATAQCPPPDALAPAVVDGTKSRLSIASFKWETDDSRLSGKVL